MKFEEQKESQMTKESKIVSCLSSGKIVTASNLERKQICPPIWFHNKKLLAKKCKKANNTIVNRSNFILGHYITKFTNKFTNK